MAEAGAGIKVPLTSPNQIQPASTPEHLPLYTQQTTTPPNTEPDDNYSYKPHAESYALKHHTQ